MFHIFAKMDKIEYNCSIPTLKNVNEDAPIVPIHYKNLFDLNNQTNQNLIDGFDERYFKYNISRNKIENSNFKTIMTINHDKILHICCNVENDDNCFNSKFLRFAITQRNKHKFLTIIYFRPKHEE